MAGLASTSDAAKPTTVANGPSSKIDVVGYMHTELDSTALYALPRERTLHLGIGHWLVAGQEVHNHRFTEGRHFKRRRP
eukprot:4852364-Pleurochrysis_carterae.AAC.3